MYGCCKPNKEPYVVSNYYNHNDKEIPYDKKILRELIKKFSLRESKWNDSNQTKLKDKYSDNISEAFSELGVKKRKIIILII